MKLIDLIEQSWLNGPEYDEPTSDGFVNRELDDEMDFFKWIGWDKDHWTALVQHSETKQLYIINTDSIDTDYYITDYYHVIDTDGDQYDEPSENSSLEPHSVTMFASIMFNMGKIANTLEEWESGEKDIALYSKNFLKELYQYDKKTFITIMKIIKEYNARKIKSKND